MVDDAHLLRQFVEARSEAAFADLVHRHLPLVYHAAARQLGSDRHLAEDITQSVFVLLARKSGSLLEHPSLAGWLHTATHFKCARELRNIRRRQWRENIVAAMNELERDSTREDWERIRPVLDQVLQELNARDREAVLLRFFENCSFADIAARLRLTESAAHKCVERALDKLRLRLAHRGVKSTAALAALLGSHGALAAPAGLGASVIGTVLASGVPISATAGLALMTTKTTALIAVSLIVGVGIATYELHLQRVTSETLNSVERDVSAMRAKLAVERDRFARERAAQAAAAQPAGGVARAAASTANAAPRPISPEEAARTGRDFLKAHPEVEAVLADNFKASVRHNYSEFITAMRLTEPEIERFVSVMMKVQMRTVDDKVLRLTDELPPPDEYARQLKEVLGEERYQHFRDYGASAPSRTLANELTRALYHTPSAPTPEQLVQFRAVVQQVVADRTLAPRNPSGWSSIPQPMWNEILKRTNELLSPPQREALIDLQQLAIFLQAQSQAFRAYTAKK